jgi:Na+/H+ antiporter NhaC
MENYGILSLLPPLVAVALAWRYKNVLAALFAGSLAGTLILFRGNPMTAVVDLIRNYIFVQAADSYNSNLLVMMVFIGGFVGVVTYSGGARAFAEKSVALISSRARAQVATWLGGILVFFSDSASPLLVGSVFQPICDKMRVSREKLAWLLDTTASPVCILVPFIGWGIYIQGLIQKEYAALHLPDSEWDVFLQVIPFQFYALGALIMAPLVAFLGFEFSAMYRAEKRTRETGQPFWPEAKPLRPSVELESFRGSKPRASLIVVPLVILFACIVGLLVPYGFPFTKINGSMLRTALCTGYFLGAMACIAMMIVYKIKTAGEAYAMYVQGAKEMMFILLILVLAWSLGSVCKAVGTAGYIVELARGTVPGWAVPALIFVTGSLISFATGSSWGTFAILMPLAIPMAHGLGAPILVSIGAVLSGGLFGDHCSPISDTTILSSMGGACDHIDHVKTQLPYAATVALASLCAYLVAGFYPAKAVLGLSLALVAGFLVVFGKIWGHKVTNYTLDDIRAEAGRDAA